MGRKTGKKKRGAAKNTVPKRAPLVAATVFGGSYSLKVPQGWMHPAEVLASGLDARPSEQFVSRRALSGPGFATLMVDLAPANIRDLGGPSGRLRLKEFLRYQEEENDVTLDSADEFKCSEPPFEHAWLVEYRSVGKLQGRTTETTAILMTSPEADMILRLNNGDAENVDWAPIVASLRRNPQVPLPKPTYPSNWPTEAEALSRLLVPETIKLDLDELRAVVNDRDRDAKILWMVAQAMCYSPAELASMDVLLDGGRDDVLVAEEQEGQRIRGHGRHAHGLPRTTTRRSPRGDRRARDDGRGAARRALRGALGRSTAAAVPVLPLRLVQAPPLPDRGHQQELLELGAPVARPAHRFS